MAVMIIPPGSAFGAACALALIGVIAVIGYGTWAVLAVTRQIGAWRRRTRDVEQSCRTLDRL